MLNAFTTTVRSIVINRHSSNLIKRTMTSSSSSFSVPASMKGSPTLALVPPGKCQFGEEPKSVSLLERTQVSPTSYLLKFSLPDTSQPLNLSTCACILANATIQGESITRPYTPISTNAQIGSFDLLIKDYGPDMGTMSYYLCETLQVGEKDAVSFKHIPFNVKTQAPFDQFDAIGMLVGGTGITPMIQALHAILGSDKKTPVVTMLYGSKVSNDIVGKELLHKWANEYPDQFKLIDVLSHEPADSDWKGETGFIDQKLIEKHFPKPSDSKSFQLWVCGPAPMYNALCGPRDEKEVKGLLGDMKYSPEQVYKF